MFTYFFPFLFFTSCVSTIQTVNSQNDLSLKEDEGFVLLRVINPNARRVVDEFFDGDGVKVNFVNGRVLKWREILDYYDLSVEDNFSEIQKSKNTSAFLMPYSDYEFVNQSKITSKMKPLHCHIFRED